jgi:Flp pilus assembly protein TadD
MNLGQTYLRLGRTSDARREFETVLQIQPSHAQAAAALRALTDAARRVDR